MESLDERVAALVHELEADIARKSAILSALRGSSPVTESAKLKRAIPSRKALTMAKSARVRSKPTNESKVTPGNLAKVAEAIVSNAMDGQVFTTPEVTRWVVGVGSNTVRRSLTQLRELRVINLEKGAGNGPGQPAHYTVRDRDAVTHLMSSVQNGGGHAA